jgi:UDP-glucose 4-epimerase
MKLLITGGAGYIGSHIVWQAQQAGHECVAIDNLSTGVPSRVDCEVAQIDLAAEAAVGQLEQLLARRFDAVIHLAARKQVGESVEKPELYFKDNIGGLANLLIAMRNTSHHKLVFSSSAATYGMPDQESVSEEDEAKPINPYGQTKLVGEWMVANAKQWGLKPVSLRYFNVAGTGKAGLADTAALNLIPIAIAQLRRGEAPIVFGNDYPTPDGSCIRDYVHVSDLANAHIAAVDYLAKENRPYDVFNIGSGQGASVIEVLDELKAVSGIHFQYKISERRAGDPPRLVADVSRMKQVLGISTSHSLRDIVESAWNL